ncbi:hypothetical protein BT96DRAFT_153052 [Gymnopus androsaceus JB14]|uniref:F-box domain-containing protein n=1 Tax=Gymnopus androsaceus JB14 TaxID=1447944 RepID=A0A6A4IEP4_9AGAR|nr:hypothetical protein BT96DRAFT_153052 [Gymnopus androsaceus JB14]
MPNQPIYCSCKKKSLKHQVKSLEAQISELTRLKDAKLVELALFRNILSPIRRAPVEILSEIFELACLLRMAFSIPNMISSYTCILFLVCVQLGESSFMRLLDFGPSSVLIRTDTTKPWLMSCGLKSGLIGAKTVPRATLELSSPIRTLDLAGYPKSYIALFNLPRSSFSQLEQVTLSIEHRDEHRDCLPQKIQALLDAPNLHNVQMCGARGAPLSLY